MTDQVTNLQSQTLTPHVMIDLETMSTRSDAAIVAIGAVKFSPYHIPGLLGDPDDPEYRHFYAAVDLNSAIESGAHVDGNTILWWLKQSQEAKAALNDSPMPLQAALNEFMIWFGPQSSPTWGNGSAFDCVVLRNAYLKTGVYPPYRYSDERCYRTIRSSLPDVEFVPPTLAHHAREDAVAQAVHLQKLFSQLNQKG